MFYNVVTNMFVMEEVKKCSFFKRNLGIVSTVDAGLSRNINPKDKFAYHYQTCYKTFIYAQGNIGNIKFYIDHYIKEPLLAIYSGESFEEFIYNVDFKTIREKGIDFFLGHILKETDKEFEERSKNNALIKQEKKNQDQGDAEKVLKNPGAVTWADVKAYMELQNQERFKKN